MGLFGNKQKTKSQLSPWAPAMPGMQAAMDIGAAGLRSPWQVYGGQQVAGLSPYQMQGIHALGSGANNALPNLAGAYGAGGMSGAYGGYQNVLGASAPQVGQLDFGYAGRAATNPFMDQMIDAASRDVMRQFNEQAMPGIARDAWARSDPAGSYRGIAEGIAQRGAQDAIYDISAGLRGSAYSQGLGIAQQQAMANPAFALQAQGQQLAAAGGLADLARFGMPFGFSGQNTAAMNQIAAGGMLQSQQQQELDQRVRDYYLQQQMPFQQAQMGLGLYSPLAAQFGQQRGEASSSMGLGNMLVGTAGSLAGAAMTGGYGLNPMNWFTPRAI